ncbi:MAG: hypothetical protein ACP5O8_03130 [Candidatus Aenigmatarchaeota archaeon]
MVKIAIGGYCQACNRFSPGLYTCPVCKAKVCPACVVPGQRFCVLCKGKVKK